jgi:hypothetical protein
MRAVRSFVGVVLTLGIIGWLDAAPSREVGSDVPDSSPMIQQVAPQNHEIAASTNWIKGCRRVREKSLIPPFAWLRVILI